MKTEKNHAIENGKGWLSSIMEYSKRLASEDDNEREAAQQEVQESILEIKTRSGWHNPGEQSEDEEFFILLSTGGPALRIVGDLYRGEPSDVRMQWQDWGTPWTPMPITREE